MAEPRAVTRSQRLARLPANALFGALFFGALSVLGACAGGAAGLSDRYPEEKRPEAARSASDGEVLGASEQDPEDSLEGSLTTEHGAPRSPHAELPTNEAAHEQLEQEECVEASKATPPAPGAEARKKPVCSPPPPPSSAY